MKKVFLYFFVFLLAVSLVFAAENSACTDSDGGDKPFIKGQVQPITEGDDYSGFDYCYTGPSNESYLSEGFCGQNGPEKGVYSCPNGCTEGACIEQNQGNSDNQNSQNQNQNENQNQENEDNNQGQSPQLQVQTNGKSGSTIKSQNGNVEAKTSMEMSQDEAGKTYAELSNGMKAEVKVMPETASQKALAVLRAKCEARGCQIELKEVGKGDQAKLVYEVKAKKDVKALGLIKSEMTVKAQIDVETGEVIKTKKAWWGFLAKEQ
ncbi:MAG: hypothetical protein ACP5NZ_05370 [Nanobdellota archaeon]